MPDAIIKGEVHSSEKDKEEFKDLIEENPDLVFVEGREPHLLQSENITYFLFIIGHLVWLNTINKYHYEESKAPNEDIKDFILLEDSLDVLYENISKLKKLIAFTLAYSSSILGLVSFLALSSISIQLSAITYGLISIMSSLLVLLLYFALLVVLIGMKEREKMMVSTIKDKVEEDSAEKVLINCGELHVSYLEAELEEKMNLEINHTSSKTGRILYQTRKKLASFRY